jgi:hypothetical protein
LFKDAFDTQRASLYLPATTLANTAFRMIVPQGLAVAASPANQYIPFSVI